MSVQTPVENRSTHHWQRELACAVRTRSALLQRLQLPEASGSPGAADAAAADFPVLVPESYL